MRKILLFGSLSLLILGQGLPAAQSPTAAEILEKMIEANGGREALAAIKDMTITGEMEMVSMGMAGTMTMYHKEPGMLRQDMEIMGMAMTQAFDGEMAWYTNPQTQMAEEAPPEMGEYSKRGALEMGNSLLLDPEKFGITYNAKGKETIEGREYFVLERAFADGVTTTLYVDSQTFYVYKQTQLSLDMMGGEVEQDIFFADYKEMDGIPYPTTMTIEQGGETFAIISVTAVTFNSGLEDSLFKMR